MPFDGMQNRRTTNGATMKTLPLKGFSTPQDEVSELDLDGRIDRAVKLLQDHEPEGGYYVAFSGGKDSCAILWLVKRSGVKFDAWYNNTTIDPPELVKFIKRNHPEVQWNQPRHGNMMKRVATAPKVPPTRSGRWCCSEYKEQGGRNRTKVMGVRAAESPGRRARWAEVAEDMHRNKTICPVVYWADDDIWELLHGKKVSYCELYDQGWTRLGCVGCPLASRVNQDREFKRWPKYEANWKKAVMANWEKWKDIPSTKTGKPRYQAKFKTGKDFWEWWRNHKAPDPLYECQSGLLWTNEEMEL